jgi:hypothetical protein
MSTIIAAFFEAMEPNVDLGVMVPCAQTMGERSMPLSRAWRVMVGKTWERAFGT